MLTCLVLSPDTVQVVAGQIAGTVTTVAGNSSLPTGRADGVGTAASFFNPWGVAMDAAGTFAVIVSVLSVSTVRLTYLAVSPRAGG